MGLSFSWARNLSSRLNAERVCDLVGPSLAIFDRSFSGAATGLIEVVHGSHYITPCLVCLPGIDRTNVLWYSIDRERSMGEPMPAVLSGFQFP